MKFDQECAGGQNHAKECEAFARAGIRVDIGASVSWDKSAKEYQVVIIDIQYKVCQSHYHELLKIDCQFLVTSETDSILYNSSSVSYAPPTSARVKRGA